MQRKIGEGSLAAAVRQGHKEIGRIVAAFPEQTPVIEEPGAFNNPTSYAVSKQTGAVESKDDQVYGQLEAVDKSSSLRSQLMKEGSVHGPEAQPAAAEPSREAEASKQPEPELEP